MWLTRKHKYDILPEDAQDLIREAPHRSQNRYARALLVTVKIGAIVLLFLAGYVCGTFYPLVSPLGRITLPSHHTIFHYNRTFSLAPTNDSLAAWNALLPSGSGFVQHPRLAPQPSSIAAFHQLHCLNMLWLLYYQNSLESHGDLVLSVHDSKPALSLDGEKQKAFLKPGHVRHCFDYLRQSIMCAADSNIEPVDKKLGGVTGWGSVRVCRSFDTLVAWASEHSSGGKTSIL